MDEYRAGETNAVLAGNVYRPGGVFRHRIYMPLISLVFADPSIAFRMKGTCRGRLLSRHHDSDLFSSFPPLSFAPSSGVLGVILGLLQK